MKNLSDLFMLRPGITYLNHGSFGACPKPVFEVYQKWQRELEEEPVEFLGRRFADLMYNARQSLGQFLNAGVEDLLFVANATTGLNIVAHSLPLKPGDEVLSTNQEYGAMDRMWEHICKKSGARYIRHPIPLPVTSKEDVTEKIWSGATRRTKVLFFSHITSVTAFMMPIRELVTRARDSEILVVVDGAHAPGQIDLDLESLGVDFYAGNCHKWMMAPKGVGFLYARPEKQHLIDPLIVSWGDQSKGDSRFIQENEFQGTKDIAAYLSVTAAIDFIEKHHWPEVREQSHALVLEARKQMAEKTGIAPLCPGNKSWLRQMVAEPLPTGLDGMLLKKRLFDEYSVEIPVNEMNGEQYIRISVQGYNNESDVELFLDAFEKLLSKMI